MYAIVTRTSLLDASSHANATEEGINVKIYVSNFCPSGLRDQVETTLDRIDSASEADDSASSEQDGSA